MLWARRVPSSLLTSYPREVRNDTIVLFDRIRENLENVSREIILVQAKRKLQKGYKFSKDTSMQLMFENEFPYEVTPDQEKAINDVKKDMESIIPMDRFVVMLAMVRRK